MKALPSKASSYGTGRWICCPLTENTVYSLAQLRFAGLAFGTCRGRGRSSLPAVLSCWPGPELEDLQGLGFLVLPWLARLLLTHGGIWVSCIFIFLYNLPNNIIISLHLEIKTNQLVEFQFILTMFWKRIQMSKSRYTSYWCLLRLLLFRLFYNLPHPNFLQAVIQR